MHWVDLPFSCSLNERLLDVIIKRSTWKEIDPKHTHWTGLERKEHST